MVGRAAEEWQAGRLGVVWAGDLVVVALLEAAPWGDTYGPGVVAAVTTQVRCIQHCTARQGVLYHSDALVRKRLVRGQTAMRQSQGRRGAASMSVHEPFTIRQGGMHPLLPFDGFLLSPGGSWQTRRRIPRSMAHRRGEVEMRVAWRIRRRKRLAQAARRPRQAPARTRLAPVRVARNWKIRPHSWLSMGHRVLQGARVCIRQCSLH